MPQDPGDFDNSIARVRAAAMAHNNRAWELVEQETRSFNEVREMCEAAISAQAMWAHTMKHAVCIERLRAEQLVACAMARADRMEEAQQAAQSAKESEAALDASAVTNFDRVMTMIARANAHTQRELEPTVLTAIDALDESERALAMRLLPGVCRRRRAIAAETCRGSRFDQPVRSRLST